MMTTTTDSLLDPYRWTVTKYHRLSEAGILDEDAGVELINGQIIKMSPVGDLHAACVDLLDELLRDLLGKKVQIRVQNPIVLNDFSEPEPDLAILRRRTNFYADGAPRPEDVLLVIEVADTTLAKDRLVKKTAYAAAGIAEYWIVNLPERQVEQYLRPAGDDYQRAHTYKADQTVESEVTGPVTVEKLFPAF